MKKTALALMLGGVLLAGTATALQQLALARLVHPAVTNLQVKKHSF